MKAKTSGLLSEEVRDVAAGGDAAPEAGTDVENPYWADPPPHPCPEKGCIRRGLCCSSSPGWFAPGEIEAAAALLGLAPDAFVRTYCVIDAWDLPEGRVEVFAPLKLARDGSPALPPLSRADGWYRLLRGACVFFEGGGCRIYAARPAECRAYLCTNPPEQNLSHEQLARRWREGS